MSDAERQPISVLHRLSEESATGELICAMSHAEVHVHLQEGRIAWATSTAAQFAFTRFVAKECGLDADAFRELINECRVERKPLGETLIAWGIATEEFVRDALRRQIAEAVATLRTAGAAETVFLRRGAGYRSYNRYFTFPLAEVDHTQRRPHRSSQRLPALFRSSPDDLLRTRLDEISSSEHDIRWVEHHRDRRVLERLPEDSAPLGIEEIVPTVMGPEVDFVALRGPTENVIGIELGGDEGSVWCGVDPEVVLGGMIPLLRDVLRRDKLVRPGHPARVTGEARIAEDRGIPRRVLSELMESSPEVWGVALNTRRGETHCLACRETVTSDTLKTRVIPLSRLLQRTQELQARYPGEVFPRGSVVASSPQGWYFGAQLFDETGRDLWLLVDPVAGQGIGWALLTALLRRTSLTAREVSR